VEPAIFAGDHAIQFIMRLIVGLKRGAGGLQRFRFDGENETLTGRERDGKVGEDIPDLM